jgi:class 3 adenylate cyclase
MAPGPVKRKLTAILAADAVGYSRHMAADEEGTMKILSAHRAVIDGIIEFHEGRIINTAGDSVLAEFASPTDAVRCAVEIQDALKTRNDSLPEVRRLYFRIGVNLGDVMVKGDDLLGDGVNVAARLEGIAEPGNIYISSSVYDQISGKLDLGFSDMGEQALKNIDRPIRVYRVDREGRRPSAAAPLAKKQQRSVLPWVAAAGAFVAVAAGGVWYYGQMESARQQEEAKAKAAAAETARLRAEAEAAKQRAEQERAAVLEEKRAMEEKQRAAALEAKRALEEKQAAEARARSQAEVARARSEAEDARRKAQAELAAAEEARRAAAKAAAAPPPAPRVAANRYQGAWNAEFDCPAFRTRPAANIKVPVVVTGDAFELQHRVRDQPGSFNLRGVPETNGAMRLLGGGFSGFKDTYGTPYSVAFEGRFAGERFEGSGKLGARDCNLVMTRGTSTLAQAPAASKMDGVPWDASFNCAAFEGQSARIYPARVTVAGQNVDLHMGQPDKPGWLHLQGLLQRDGSLQLSGKGISGHEKYRGRTYDASFDGRVSGGRYEGSGRMGRRDCTLTIVRK